MKIFNIRDYGAKTADTLQTAAIQAAIDDCFLAGGGRVLVPCGLYWTGGLRIRSGVELYLESGAILKGSLDPKDYFGFLEDTVEPVTVEPVGNTPATGRSAVATSDWCNALIRALDAHDFAIIGEKGSYFDGSNVYNPNGENDCRGPHGISVWRCNNMRFEGYTFLNSSNWCHAIFQSRNITIRNVAVHGGFDGIDIRTCDEVLIEDCNLNTGDDAVAGYDNHNVTVRNCKLNSVAMPLRIGGNNFLVENCVSDERNFGQRLNLSLEKKVRNCISDEHCRHESHAVFSYYCDFRAILRKPPENIVIRNCHFAQAREVMRLEFTGLNRWCRQKGLQEITFENCFIGDLYHTGMLWGDAEEKVTCRFKNVTFACREGANQVPMLAIGNVKKLVFEDCTFQGYEKPVFLMGTDDEANVELIRSGEIDLRRVSFEECVAAHPGGVATQDKGKFLFWNLKDPTAPPVPGKEPPKK
ncbi:MAG: right-handed parallel beta-helix repeat-containing protein [Clostridia bacterium]|nr:right-handed parallel beta-helix repeat-containing protein [Clostridia bacterium]